MKRLGIRIALAGFVAGLTATASAGEPLAVSPSTLGSMGFATLRAMADDEGMAVRGQGFDFGFKHKGFDGFKHKSFDKKGFDHKKGFDKGFDHKKGFGHKSFGHKDFGHKSFGGGFGHKMGGGMIWQPKAVVWGGFGGKF